MSRAARPRRLVITTAIALLFCVPITSDARRQWLRPLTDADNDAIRYSSETPFDAIAQLQQKIDSGTTTLQFETKGGYLRSLLRELAIPVASQVLVFSKTSSQRALISPHTPRAVYFGPDVYVGWVQNSHILEIASMDPKLGAVFYTLDQDARARPVFRRQTEKCLQCHDSLSLTAGVPGFIAQSVVADKEGEPIVSARRFTTNDRSPLKERWGGWYVTAAHDDQVHMGTAVPSHLNLKPYLSRHSDVTALLVLNHQTHVHNLITRANYRTRMALAFDRIRNKETGRPDDDVPDRTMRLVREVSEPLVEALLFAGEAPLTRSIAGTSGFAADFARDGPKDKAGRSLRDLDLTRRVFRYPCSYLIYSDAFDALPAVVKQYVFGRLREVLTGVDRHNTFKHLSLADRNAILGILLDTQPTFSAWYANP
jgi:hypothetical protein